MDGSTLRDYFTDAIRFWEPRRVIYNAVLAAIVIAYFAVNYPSSKMFLSVDFFLGLFLLAVVANVAYCAAYLVDLLVQASGFWGIWRRARWSRFIAMGMFRASAQ